MTCRPNVLLMIPHDLGDWLGCYGHPSVRSPNLDRLAETGVRFTSYFTTAPECTSSRGSMLTGLYPHQNGLPGLSGMGWELTDPNLHLAHRLKAAGYRTHLFGVQHETAGDARQLGYEQLHSQDNRGVAAVCSALAGFLKTPDAAERDKPWFAHAGFVEVHNPYPDETSFAPESVELPSWLPDRPEVRLECARFHQNILKMDAAVGTVCRELEAQGLAENTLVLFTTDHGAYFPRAKTTYFDAGIHIPLIARMPGRIPGGRRLDDLLSNVDLVPTVLDWCGAPAPAHVEGRSFRPLLEGAPLPAPRDAVFGGMYYDCSYDPMHFVRTRRWKYIRSYGVTGADAAGADLRVLATFKGGPWVRFDDYSVMTSQAWKTMQAAGVPCPMPAPEELYDLEADPLEQRNRAADPACRPVLEDMRKRLGDLLARTGASLPGRHVPPPARQVELCLSYGRKLGIRP